MKIYRNLCEAVATTLDQIFRENKYADKVIEKVLKSNARWGARDRRFIAETTYDIVRWQRLFSHISGAPSHDFWTLIGVWCVWNDVPLPPWDEFRNVDPEKLETEYQKVANRRAIRESIPDWLDNLAEAELGKNWEQELEALNEEAGVVLRINSLKTTRNELQGSLADDEIGTTRVLEYPDALLLENRQNIFSCAQFKEGLFEVQDAGSQAIAPFLQVEPGMRVIDACAGAGGKTLHLAALMQNKGRIIAMDSEEWKLEELKKRARRAGAANIETRIIESSKTIKRLEASADRLLLDVPCSGLGVLRRNPDAKWKLSADFVEKTKQLQEKILLEYCQMLKPGGKMVYSTCSILPSENEKQVESFLKNVAGKFRLQDQRTILPSQGFDGFYMARLEKIS